ncbi:hypothetical protein NDU88_004902, partial [Pleurodeles waltl]
MRNACSFLSLHCTGTSSVCQCDPGKSSSGSAFSVTARKLQAAAEAPRITQ